MAELREQVSQIGGMLYTPEMLELQSDIHHRLVRETDFATLEAMSNDQLKDHIHSFAVEVLNEHDRTLPARTLDQLIECVKYEISGYGPLELLLSDDAITEIMVNGPDQVMVEREGKISQVAGSRAYGGCAPA